MSHDWIGRSLGPFQSSAKLGEGGMGELQRALGEPRVVTEGKGRWHIHSGSLSTDGVRAGNRRRRGSPW